ncbi:MAG: hypothetical protein L0170_00115 [Acidobacteria bacterium]|nr:hypothetical protein [Acidobacteriota bacterium]
MELGVIPDAQAPDDESRAEGKSWCLSCNGLTLHRRESIEFLGNPVKSSYFCLQCGERTDPRAADRNTARSLRSEERRLRVAAGVSFALMLLLPLLLLAAIFWLAWRIL